MFKSTPSDISITQGAWKQAVNEKQRAWYLREHLDIPPEIRSIIEAGSVRVGMTTDQCRAGWGVPFEVIRTTTAYGTNELWSYSGSLPGYGFIKGGSLYFEDGILAMIQD